MTLALLLYVAFIVLCGVSAYYLRSIAKQLRRIADAANDSKSDSVSKGD